MADVKTKIDLLKIGMKWDDDGAKSFGGAEPKADEAKVSFSEE
jgi:hypothetical protein